MSLHFFISRAGEDAGIAQWIADVLEDAGHLTTVQDYDFKSGAFPAHTNAALHNADRFIAVLSPHYPVKPFTVAELHAAYARDPLHFILPVRVEPCNPPDLIKHLIYVDFVGHDDEALRKQLLLDAIAPPRHALRTPPIRRPVQKLEVFVSYSHKDERIWNELDKHLAGLRRADFIETWNDRKIGPGKEFGHEIAAHLETADVVLLLVSADFLSSDYCYCTEMTRAMERHERGEARVIPIILRACEWHETPFGKLLALPRDGKPVNTWAKRDSAFLDIVKSLRGAVKDIARRPGP